MEGDPVRAVQRLGGVARWAELRPLVTRSALRSCVAAGVLVRPGRGSYALPELPPARLAAARLGGVVSHESAAAEHGLAMLLPPRQVSVAVRPNAHPPAPRLVRLRWAALGDGDVTGDVTTPLRTVLDCAAVLAFAEALAVADSALRTRQVGVRELRDAAHAWRGHRSRAVRRVAAAADGRADNPFESGLRAAVLEAGCTGFVPQLRVDSDPPARVDLGDRRRRIALEADSFAWHGSRQALERDCRRYDELVRRGWVVLRFAWEHVALRPAWVAEVVADVTARHTGRTSAPPRRRRGSPAPTLLPVVTAQNNTVAKVPVRRKPTRR